MSVFPPSCNDRIYIVDRLMMNTSSFDRFQSCSPSSSTARFDPNELNLFDNIDDIADDGISGGSTTDDESADDGRRSLAFDRADQVMIRGQNPWLEPWVVQRHCRLPAWLRDNGFLVASHRPPLESYVDCVRLMFRLHTETWNVWTHFIGIEAI